MDSSYLLSIRPLTMELRQLRYFSAIAEHGTFSKAAEKLFVAQSALSHQLAQLEDELGAKLFHRSRRGAELTDAGKVFLAHAAAILRQVDDARASVQRASDAPAGRVVFGVPHSVSSALALPLLRAIRQRFPLVELELTEELTGNLVRQLRAGQLHLSILFDDGQLDEFTHQTLLRERMSLIGPPDHPDTLPASGITLRDALKMPLILPASPHGVRPVIEAAARSARCPPPDQVTDISSISILRTSLLAGFGYTLLPVAPLQHEIDAGLLRAVPVVSPLLSRTVSICASRHIPLSSAAEAVLRLTAELARELSLSGAWPDATPVTDDEAP